MGLCSWIIFGFIVGAIARFLLPGPQHLGFIRTTVLGIAGSFAGGFLSALVWGGSWRAPSSAGFIGSIIGAVVLLAIFEGLSTRKR